MKALAIVALCAAVNASFAFATQSRPRTLPGNLSSNAVSDGSNGGNSSLGHTSGGPEYVILFDPDHPEPPQVSQVLARLGLNESHPDVGHTFNNSMFSGFSGNMNNHCINALNAMPGVKYVEQAVRVGSFATQVQTNSPWGLQRVSQQGRVGGDVSEMQFQYKYDSGGDLGRGVDIYVVDTGINTDHLAFGGRATMGFSMKGNSDLNSACDQDGHGTHVSGTAAADLFGVASGANLIGVKVLGADGSGTSSDTIKGLDYVIQQHNSKKQQPGFVGSIASMSWGLSSRSPTVEQAINAAVAAGVHVSVAAGNQNQNACNSAPSSTGGSGASGTGGKAVAVGSTSNADVISSFSNTGPCVDVYAPGEDVISTWINGSDTVQTLSGTSMATPHVTGVMAYLMARNNTLANSPLAMKQFLATSAISGALTGSQTMTKGDRGLLINNGLGRVQGLPSAARHVRHKRTAATHRTRKHHSIQEASPPSILRY